MGKNRTEWLHTAAGISSFRAMYEFAALIIQNAATTARDKRAARKVYGLLRDIIHLPIADAARLMKARQCFAKLVASLRVGVDDALAANLLAHKD